MNSTVRGSGKLSFHLREEQLTRNTDCEGKKHSSWQRFTPHFNSVWDTSQLRITSPCKKTHGFFPVLLSGCCVQSCVCLHSCSHLKIKVLQELEALHNNHSFSLSLHFPPTDKGTDRGGSRGGCDGNWRAEPKSLPCQEGSSGGPTLPQHPVRFTIQADRSADGPQWERRGQLTFNTEICEYATVNKKTTTTT